MSHPGSNDDDHMGLVLISSDSDEAEEDSYENHEELRPELRPQPDVMELFSIARLALAARLRGLRADYSIDLNTGHDILDLDTRAEVWRILTTCKPKVLITSAPCTFWSRLMDLWNFRNMTEDDYQRRRRDAIILLNFSMACCKEQHTRRRRFLHEHPGRARSWRHDPVLSVRDLDGVMVSTFDQCRFGLVGPFSGKPIQKTTTFLHNMPSIEQLFGGKRCICQEEHQTIQGSDQGYRLSTWCQRYTPLMVNTMIDGVIETLASEP